jgi:high-affinity nickel-transport protein
LPKLTSRSWIGYAAFVIALHILGILGLCFLAGENPAFWGIGTLAYTLGVRHAFDVDHIAAIDNTVRKLLEQKRNPLGVGFYFSLGHSSVVFLMVLGISLSVHWLQDRMDIMKQVGGVIGTTVSGSFLLIIGLLNLIILLNLVQLFRKMKRESCQPEELEELLLSRGFFNRLTRPFFRFIGKSWHVYPLGFLFGLGFDTASEIGLLAISATASKTSATEWGVLSLPLLFAAGMSLFDTADGMFMTKAYRWAFLTPVRKMYYNFTVTALSVFAALFIGGVELIQVLCEKLGLQGPFWNLVAGLNFNDLGYILAISFVLAWAVSYGIWKRMRLEERWG